MRRQNMWLYSPESNQLSKGRKRKVKRFTIIADVRTRVASQSIRVQNNRRRQLFIKWLGGLQKSLLEDGVNTNVLHRLKGTLKNM